jgi:predicted AAA+ superfamily ATPase
VASDEIMFERKITEKLIDWKKTDDGTSALLIEGARRIGKTTIADEFGKRFYKSHIIINFSTDPGVVRLFEENQDNLDGFFDAVSVYYSIPLYKRDSLIVFDEVQFFRKPAKR